MGCLCDMSGDPKVKAIIDKLKTEAVKTVDKCVTERLKIEAEKALKILKYLATSPHCSTKKKKSQKAR